MKSGINNKTGKLMTGLEYLRQRLSDVINTPLGSLVGRRKFGSKFYTLIDRNVDGAFYMDAYVVLSDAINNPENGLDDFKLTEMVVEKEGDAHFSITIYGKVASGESVQIDGITYG